MVPITAKPIPNLTDRIRMRLKGLQLNRSFKIADDEIPPDERQAWYHAARSMGIKVSVKTTPAGTHVWRIR